VLTAYNGTLLAKGAQLSLIILLKVNASTQYHIIKPADLLYIINDTMVSHFLVKALLAFIFTSTARWGLALHLLLVITSAWAAISYPH
jgi:hypothetical protein